MRQHPIPQNILDVEFKLFTYFTVKEFAYVATGAIIGGIFIYLWTQNRIPGIIAFPSLIFFGGTGLILGTVPIQDQPADKIFSNYIKAINRPTLRVWQGEEMKLKMKTRKNAGKASVTEVQKHQTEQVGLTDVEEREKLEKIGQMMEETGLGQRKAPPPTREQRIVITKENVEQYALPNVKAQLVGTINMVLVNKQGQPIKNAIVIVKDNLDRARFALKSGNRGEVLSTKRLEGGEYKVEIKHENYMFSPIRFIVEKPVYPIIKISSI